jgi:hypothetical protein
MTETERIAVELLGWEQIHTNDSRLWEEYQVDGPLYRKSATEVWIQPTTGTWSRRTHHTSPSQEYWPDFTTLDGCRLFEEELRKRFMLHSFRRIGYLSALQKEFQKDDHGAYEGESILMATPDQRVAACLRVLDQLKETK